MYGSDDRKEFFETADPALRATMSGTTVALVPRVWISQQTGDLAATVQTWGERDGLCADEPFADQPAAAFCTGVLVDWDLVLTAGHCARQLPLEDIVAVFDYFYQAPGQLALRRGDSREIVAIEAEAIGRVEDQVRLDYAWLRLREAVAPPRQPARVYVRSPPLEPGDPVVAMGAGGGVPLKLDAGGAVRDARAASLDYFVADTDTSHGSSGGGAFDRQLALVGVLARGGADLMRTPAGCNATVRQDGAAAAEQYTYVHRVVAALCKERPGASSLCRQDCDDPCQALPAMDGGSGGGCAVSDRRPARDASTWIAVVAIALTRRRRLRSNRA